MRNVIIQELEAQNSDDIAANLSYAWKRIRVPIIVPILNFALYMCVAMSIMLFAERVYMMIVIICVKLLGKKRYTKYKLEAIKEDLEQNKSYPMVLIQIPMFNEREVGPVFFEVYITPSFNN